MTKAAMASVVFWSVATVAFAQAGKAPQGAWLQDGIKWANAPKEINPRLSSGRAAIVYFGPNHAFAVIYATVNRVQRQYEVICNGCGQVVYSGTWEIDKKTIKVKYRLVSRTVEVAGEQLPGPLKEDTANLEGDAIVFLGHSFHRAADLDANVREFVSPGIAH